MMFRHADSVVLQVVDDRAFLLDETGTEMIVLNTVGTMVWEALDGPLDADAIAQSLEGRFEDVSFADVGERCAASSSMSSRSSDWSCPST